MDPESSIAETLNSLKDGLLESIIIREQVGKKGRTSHESSIFGFWEPLGLDR